MNINPHSIGLQLHSRKLMYLIRRLILQTSHQLLFKHIIQEATSLKGVSKTRTRIQQEKLQHV